MITLWEALEIALAVLIVAAQFLWVFILPALGLAWLMGWLT
jgi:hypothetical protein